MTGASYDIRVRPFRSADVPAVAHFIPNRLLDAKGRWVQMDGVRACRTLLDEGAMVGAIFTLRQDAVETIVGVGGAVFVTREFLQAQRAWPQPGLAERVLHPAFGPGSPVLDKRAICRANSGEGLNLVVLLHEWDRRIANLELSRQIRIHLMKAFLADFRGYRLREILAEGPNDEATRAALAGGGFVLRDTYADWYRTRTEPSPPRMLIGITREEALAVESSVMSILFLYREPVCRFTFAERRLLRAALARETDAEIASTLGISASAVKKRWISIFNRASAALPALAADHAGGRSSPGDPTRGPQKRHKLLAYLREHPEELRP